MSDRTVAGADPGPIDSARRRAVNWALGTSVGGLLASILYPVVRFLIPPEVPESTANEVEAGPVNAPEFVARGYRIVRFGSEPVIVVRVGPEEFRAFSATCTHLDCIVEYQQDRSRIFCNCHNGVYDLTGRNVSGPPPRPLEPYRVHLVQRDDGPATVVVSRA